jgi:hypothetical protein
LARSLSVSDVAVLLGSRAGLEDSLRSGVVVDMVEVSSWRCISLFGGGGRRARADSRAVQLGHGMIEAGRGREG